MDTRFEWREEYDIGVEVIDQEHRRLFRIIDKLFRFKAEEKDSQWTCQEGIKFFKGHAVKHFADEESYMASIGYEGLEQHRRIHRDFRANILPALEQELEQSGYAPDAVEHFLGVCTGWLIGHTLTEDQAITKKQVNRWEGLLPNEELDAIKKAIVHLVFDMFRLESQAISDTYGGEKFGSGVYYRLIYGSKGEEKRQEIILVFEEKLLINAARYTARQFVGRLLEHMPAADGFELKEENLLSFEQFQKVFRKEKPQVSLLFNTGGAGYFAYCAIAPHLLEKGVGTPIDHGNAMAEVEKYLSRREEQEAQDQAAHRKKILIVDDSLTIRQAMKQLLEGDYAVSVAESGVAAIRTITLDPPDLVLLDYEMPVCDGRQTLEMLRSEEAFADIPVIFLTGRRDTDTMIKVMPLKPAGYLLKNSKPADLKKEVDHFFAKREG